MKREREEEELRKKRRSNKNDTFQEVLHRFQGEKVQAVLSVLLCTEFEKKNCKVSCVTQNSRKSVVGRIGKKVCIEIKIDFCRAIQGKFKCTKFKEVTGTVHKNRDRFLQGRTG